MNETATGQAEENTAFSMLAVNPKQSRSGKRWKWKSCDSTVGSVATVDTQMNRCNRWNRW